MKRPRSGPASVRPQIESLAEVLLERGSVGQRDIRRILGPRIMPPAWIVAEVVDALLDAEGGGSEVARIDAC